MTAGFAQSIGEAVLPSKKLVYETAEPSAGCHGTAACRTCSNLCSCCCQCMHRAPRCGASVFLLFSHIIPSGFNSSSRSVAPPLPPLHFPCADSERPEREGRLGPGEREQARMHVPGMLEGLRGKPADAAAAARCARTCCCCCCGHGSPCSQAPRQGRAHAQLHLCTVVSAKLTICSDSSIVCRRVRGLTRPAALTRTLGHADARQH